MASAPQNGTARPHPDEQHNRRIDEHEAKTAQQVAAEENRRRQVDPTEFLTEEFTGTVTDIDVDRELPDDHPRQWNVGDLLGAHTSKQLALGQLTREEWAFEKTMDKARRHLLQMGYRRPGGAGEKCTGRTRERLTGGAGEERKLLTTDLDEQLDAAMEAKSQLRSGSIGGRTFRGITEAHVVTKKEGYGRDGGDSGGRLSRLTDFFLGG